MVRPSPQTERLVEIIEVLAESKETGCSLAELAHHLGANKATLYPMLTELTSVGWLVRHPRTKLFRLGPRLVTIGRSAQESFDIVDLVHPRSLALAQALDATCMLISETPNGMVVVDVATGSAQARQRGGGRAIGLHPGDTIHLQPPTGSVLAAFGDDETRSAWLARAAPDERTELERVIECVRAQGFALEDFPPRPQLLGDLVYAAAGSAHASERARLLRHGIRPAGALRLIGEIDRAEDYHPVSINAPIFDEHGRVAHILLVTDLPLPVKGGTAREIGEVIVTLTQQITADLHSHGARP